MSTSDRGYFTPLSHDVRVRERLLGAGIISQAEIEQYLANLPDNEANSESLGIGQPALATPQPPAPPAPAPIRVSPPMSTHASAPSTDIDDDDDDDDEDDDDDDDDDVSGADEVAAAPAEEHAAPAHTIAVGEPHPSAPVETKEAVEAHKDAEAAVEAAQPEQAPAAPEAPVEAAPEASSATTEEQVG